MLLLVNKTTPRLQYVVNFVTRQLCGEAAIFTTNPKQYFAYDGVKINYTHQYFENDKCWQQPHILLFEEKIQLQTIQVFAYKEHPAFFKTEGNFGFDFFAAIFYLLSRYEEYLPHTKDEYGRYAHTNSLAYKNDFLNLPLINIWLKDVRSKLATAFPNHHFPFSTFQFIPTYDIDEAYAYKHKSSFRMLGGAVKDVLSGSFPQLKQRLKVVLGNEADPYDSYKWLNDLHSKYHLKPIYFFLMAEKKKAYDKNIPPFSLPMQQLIKQHAEKYKIGIHPSWQSGDDDTLMNKEKENLEHISEKTITTSRQHYVRFALPSTFRQLLANGIIEDHSMGYGSINGFRASVAAPFYWYDLEKEEQTSLLLYPFCFMDANAYYEQKQTALEAADELAYYYEQIKKVNGTFITLWHNNFFGSDERFKGWKEVYEAFVGKIAE